MLNRFVVKATHPPVRHCQTQKNAKNENSFYGRNSIFRFLKLCSYVLGTKVETFPKLQSCISSCVATVAKNQVDEQQKWAKFKIHLLPQFLRYSSNILIEYRSNLCELSRLVSFFILALKSPQKYFENISMTGYEKHTFFAEKYFLARFEDQTEKTRQ